MTGSKGYAATGERERERGRSGRDGRALKERKRGLDDDDDSGVNTARSSGQSATKAPKEKSHLSLLRLFSRPLVPLFRWGFSFHHTRGHRHTVVRARVHLRHARRYLPILRLPPIPLTRAGHPISLPLSLFLSPLPLFLTASLSLSLSLSLFHINRILHFPSE